MKPEPDAVADLVRSLAASPWPATDVQRREWAERFGLPVDGELVEDPGLGPGHHTLVGPPTRDWPATAWHLQRGLFVGVSWFLWHDEEQDAARRAAETLRAALADAWDAAGELRDPVHGSTAVSGAGTVQIDLSHHAPRTRPREVPSRVHLQVDHVERAAQVEAEARMAAEIEPLLERRWDPIGVYHDPRIPSPPHEYDIYAAWIAHRLAGPSLDADEARTAVRAELERARAWLGLQENQPVDDEVTDLIVGRWAGQPGRQGDAGRP